jgi:hypothetical protein
MKRIWVFSVCRPLPAGGNVYGHTVGIGELKLAVLAFGQQLESDLALGVPATRDSKRSVLSGFDRDQNKPAGVELLRDAAVDICFCVISRVEKNSRSGLSGDRYGGTLVETPDKVV